MRPAPRRTLTAQRILLVGGGCSDQAEVFRNLERRGCSAGAVPCGQEALAALRESKPSVAVLDAATPGADGYALCRRIKAEEDLQDVTVLLALPLQRRTEVVRCLECGADGFLAAPYDGEALWERVRYAAANRRSPAEEAPGDIDFACCGQRHRVSASAQRLLDVLVCAFESAVRAGGELSLAREAAGSLAFRLDHQEQRRDEAVAARKQAEEELWRSREKTRSILDSSGMAICLIGPQLEVLEANQRMGEWFPALHTASKVHCYGVLCQATSSGRCPDCPVARALRDGHVHEALHRDKRDGKPVVYRVVASALRDADGNVQGAIAIIDDVTRRTQLEQQLAQSAKLEAIGMLAGGVAHDFNNLLVIINGYSRMMADTLPPEHPLHEDARQVLEAGERAANLTRQLLAFSRRQNLEPHVLNINRLTEGISQMLRRIIGEDIELRCELGKGLGNVRVDPGQIEQVLMNLAVNARDAMPSGGRLTIETSGVTRPPHAREGHESTKPGPYVVLSVSDTGFGIPPEVADRIFEPFFTTKESGKGTGLGLAMVYGTVKQHGGFIDVVSRPGKGATFRIYLPEVDATTELMPVPDLRPEAIGGHETVLLVEDEQSVRALAERVLRKYGYNVLSCGSAQQAQDLFREHSEHVELLVTDVVMPGCDGPTLYRRLLAEGPLLRVLYVSGYSDNDGVRAGIREPGSAFLQKPFAPEALARKVRELLDASGLGVL